MADKKKTRKKSKKKTRKEDDEKEDVKKLEKIKHVEDRQLLWIVFFIFLIIGGFIGTWYYVQTLNKFEYLGLKWNVEEREGGNFDFYHTRFPVFYNANANYNLYLREDPRENNVSVNLIEDSYGIRFRPDIVISLSPKAMRCENSHIANAKMSQFLVQAVGLNSEGASTNKTYANELNASYATCNKYNNMNDTEINKTIIIIDSQSQNPEIRQNQDNENCYIIDVGKCENMKATERFMIAVLEQALGRQE